MFSFPSKLLKRDLGNTLYHHHEIDDYFLYNTIIEESTNDYWLLMIHVRINN